MNNGIPPFINLQDMAMHEAEALHQPQKELSQVTLLVRELWLGGYSEKCRDQEIESIMRMYGKIENYERHQNHTFVKYYKVEYASKAFQNHKGISIQLKSPELKIYFSDHLRRFDIVGDSFDYINEQELTNVLYIGYPANGEPLHEYAVRNACEKYYKVKGITKSVNKIQSTKDYYLVQFEKVEHAKKVYQKLFDNRHKLFRQKTDVSIVLNADKFFSKNKDIP